MELLTIGTIPATSGMTILEATDTITVAAGKNFTIETSPSGVEVLSATVPAGKSWNVTMTITVQETDA